MCWRWRVVRGRTSCRPWARASTPNHASTVCCWPARRRSPRRTRARRWSTSPNAQALGDTWLGRYGLGRAYLAAERYPEAESELEKCLARRGEVTAVFLDEIPTYRYLPPVHYYMGLVREGLKNARGATESFQTFLDMKKDGDEQGLVADARRRLGDR